MIIVRKSSDSVRCEHLAGDLFQLIQVCTDLVAIAQPSKICVLPDPYEAFLSKCGISRVPATQDYIGMVQESFMEQITNG